MKPEEFKRLLKEFAPKQALTEADIIPIGPDGNKIEDPVVIKNLNMAIKAIDSSIRTKVIDLISDPGSAKALKSPAQRMALIGAIAITFGISEQEFSQITSKIKNLLKATEKGNDQA